MTGVILTFLDLFNGWGFASSLVRDDKTDKHKIGQAFGMLILMNGGLASPSGSRRPFAADYFHQPMVADLLRVQAIFYLANPFTALGHALLMRRLEFKRQARITLIAADAQRRHRVGLRLRRPWRLDPGRRRRRCSGTRAPSAISSPPGSGRSRPVSASKAPARCFATARR